MRSRPIMRIWRAGLVATALCCAAPTAALAGWEPPQVVSKGAADVGPRSDIVAGTNGLATALFFERSGNAFTDAYFLRRGADEGTWSAPRATALTAPITGFNWVELAANASGDAVGWWKQGQPVDVATWSASGPGPSPPARIMTANSNGALGIDGAGNAYAVSMEPQGFLQFASFDAATGTWTAAQRMKTPDGQDVQGQEPQIAVNPDGDIAVTYWRVVPVTSPSDPFDRHLFVRRRLAGETAFGPEQRLDAPAERGLAFAYDVVIDPSGAITVVFTEGTSFRERVFAARWEPDEAAPPADRPFPQLSSPRPAYYPASDPRVVVDPSGRVTAAWRQQEGPNEYNLYSAENADGKGFGLPERISPATENVTADETSEPPSELSADNDRSVSSYDLAVDPEGTATIVYIDEGAQNITISSPDATTTSTGDLDVKASRRASGARWGKPVALRVPDMGPVSSASASVAAGRSGQADVIFAQEDKAGITKLFATRFEGSAPASGKHQTMVTSFDGTKILVQWCPASGLSAGEAAPTIIAGSGWGIPGRRCPGANSPEEELEGVFGSTPVKAFTDAGYNVLTFDARGFWRSGGTAQVDDPLYEGKDMQALIDYVSRQPNAQLDGPGDPRLGMSGGSYGGGIQFVTAALDHRVDAIAPSIAWNSLVTSLFPRETVKAGWAAILVGAGVPMTTLPGVLSPAGIEQGHMDQHVYDATTTAVQSGTIDSEQRAWFEDKGPDALLDRVEAPTLLIQGTVDTMFTLDEAHRNFEALEAAGTEVKMLWFCGGHGACERHGEDQEHINTRVLAWFDRYLRGRNVSTGPEFEWVDEDGGWHESASYPPRSDSVLRATGSGTLSLTPGEQPGSGGLIFATPYSFQTDHPAAVDVQIKAPAQETTVLGTPQLRATYTATGVTTYGTGVDGAAKDRTYVYAQIVDNTRNRVVGNQATPIPITLDGQEHEFSLPLERIASRSSAGGYSLQIVPQTSVYDGQRAAGVIDFRSIDVTLPLDLPGLTTAGRPTGSRPAQDATRTLRCHGRKATITGTRDRDVIRGTRRRDVIVARRGKDVIRSRGGRDLVCAGRGNDRVFGGKRADRLFGGLGADRLTGGAGRDRLLGGPGRDILRGNPLRDRLLGGAGRDRII